MGAEDVFLKTYTRREIDNEEFLNPKNLKPPEHISITENNLNIVHKEIKDLILKIVDSILKFYGILLKKNEIKKDLFENTVTNIIIKNEMHYILYTFHELMLKDKL